MDNSNTETVILGATKEAPVNEPKAVESAETAVLEATEPKETEVKQQEDEAPKAQEQAKETKAEQPKEKAADSKESPKEPTLAPKVNFENQVKTETEKPVNKEETRQVTEESVLAYLNENGLKVEKLSDLSKNVALDEEVEKFQKFKNETNLGLKDFYNSQRDWNKESKETRVAEYLKWKYPNLSDEDIQTQLELESVTEEDEAEMDPKELRKKQLEFNKLDAEALSFLSKKSKEYAVPEKTSQPQPKPTKEDIAKAHRPYWDSRDKSLDKLKEISFNIEGMGDITLTVDQEDREMVSRSTETMDSLINQWKDQDVLNTDRLVESNLWGIEPIRQKFIRDIVKQTHALALENFSKENRNVNLDKPIKETEKTNKAGLFIENDSQQNTKFGKSII